MAPLSPDDYRKLSPEWVSSAEATVRRFFPATPLIVAHRLSERFGLRVLLKLESVTPVRTFKLRGALAKVAALVKEGHRGGVVTASAGNHGLAVAHAARLHGQSALVYVPESANPQKVALIRREGAEVVEGGRDYQEAFEAAERHLSTGRALVHAYEDLDVIAGQATVGKELLATKESFEAVLMGVGGGGLIGGVALALAQAGSSSRIIGAQPKGADSLVRSLEQGKVVRVDKVETVADGLAARSPGQVAFALASRYVSKVVRIEDAKLVDACRLLLREARLVAEPAGAAGLAALAELPQSERPASAVVIISGANISDALFEKIRA